MIGVRKTATKYKGQECDTRTVIALGFVRKTATKYKGQEIGSCGTPMCFAGLERQRQNIKAKSIYNKVIAAHDQGLERQRQNIKAKSDKGLIDIDASES